MFRRSAFGLSIRAKLLLLIGILVASFAIAVATYLVLRSQAGEIRSEQAKLNALRTAMLEEGLQANGLASEQIDSQVSIFRRARARTDSAFQAVRGLKVLPRLSPLTAGALVSIEDLQQLLDGETRSLLGAASEVEEDGGKISPTDNRFTAFGLIMVEQRRRSPLLMSTELHIRNLMNEVSAVGDDFKAATTVIDSQGSAILAETQRLASQGELLALSIIVVLLAGTVALALLLASQVVRSVRSIARDIEHMRQGDLTRRFEAVTRDEIGALSNNLNEFVFSLKSSIRNVQTASAENIRMKESLIVTTEQTSASTTQMTTNSESISRRIAKLDGDLIGSLTAVQSIGESIRILNEQIQEQMAMVEESTASVTEMIASIDNITKTADKRLDATERLISTMSRGGAKMQATFDVINDIQQNVGSIEEITAIIEDLSAQTNLLSMNAAIEAAHAGQAGGGFSVVADEIRKLAAGSSRSNQEIGRILKSIVDRISEATSAGEEMYGAFREIEREAKELSASLAEIFSSMKELRSGGGQILQAMTVLRETSTNVKGGSTVINESSMAIGSTMASVQQVSAQVRGGMGEIADGIREISSAVGNLLSIAGRLGELSESLDNDLAKFRTA